MSHVWPSHADEIEYTESVPVGLSDGLESLAWKCYLTFFENFIPVMMILFVFYKTIGDVYAIAMWFFSSTGFVGALQCLYEAL